MAGMKRTSKPEPVQLSFEEIEAASKGLWCYWQMVDQQGIFCSAHCAEGRTPDCPYKSLADRQARIDLAALEKRPAYVCSDYSPLSAQLSTEEVSR